MKKPIISISIILLTVFLLTYFVLLDKYNEVISLRFQVEQKNTDFKDLEDYFKDLSFNNEELKKYESEMAKIDSALPLNPDIPSLFNFIQKTSEENGLILESLTSGPFSKSQVKSGQKIEEASDIKENSFSLSVSGSYSSFKNFLSVLEKSARLIEVENISFGSFGANNPLIPESSEDFFTFDLQMKVFSY